MIKAIILAAGKGTRLGGLTEEVPKPMLPIKGKPLLEHIIYYLKNNGFNKIGVNLFTMPEQIIDYFGDGSRFEVSVEYSHEDELKGTAGSLLPFAEWLAGEDFLVIYGDILTNQDLIPMLSLHKEKNAYATLLLHRRQVSNSCIELDKESKIVDFIERPGEEELEKLKQRHPEGFLVNSAVQILSNEILEYISANNSFDLPRDVYTKVLNDKPLYGYELTEQRIAIDSPERYQEACNDDFLKPLIKHPTSSRSARL